MCGVQMIISKGRVLGKKDGGGLPQLLVNRRGKKGSVGPNRMPSCLCGWVRSSVCCTVYMWLGCYAVVAYPPPLLLAHMRTMPLRSSTTPNTKLYYPAYLISRPLTSRLCFNLLIKISSKAK